MKFKLYSAISSIACLSLLAGCQATGEQYAANVYTSGQVNQKQEAKTVKILAIMAAKVEVDNTEAKQTAQLAGGVLGAIGGAVLGNTAHNYRGEATAAGAVGGGALGVVAGNTLVKDKVLVDGVSLTYEENKKTYSSAQVGRACEFTPGTALIISTEYNETRIQPNATCPAEEGKK
jgi:outer membrane lipoprotein SlyB